jgi:hypothetical protein
MIRRLSRFRKLHAHERRLLIQAAPLLVRSIFFLKLFGFKRAFAEFNNLKPATRGAVPAERLDEYAQAIRRASNGLGIGTCLSMSLALRELLLRNGIESEFRIGVDKVGDEFSAHAWLECDGRPIGEVVPADYRVFADLR